MACSLRFVVVTVTAAIRIKGRGVPLCVCERRHAWDGSWLESTQLFHSDLQGRTAKRVLVAVVSVVLMLVLVTAAVAVTV
jgi:hypothetical protein